MKRLPAVLYVVLFIVASAYGQSLAQSDRDRAIKHLQTTKQNILDATKGLSQAQWNFKPAPDRWSVAEVIEHIAAAEDMLFGLITEQVMKAPPGWRGRKGDRRNGAYQDTRQDQQSPGTGSAQTDEPLRLP